MTDVYTAALLPTKPSSDETEASLPLTLYMNQQKKKKKRSKFVTSISQFDDLILSPLSGYHIYIYVCVRVCVYVLSFDPSTQPKNAIPR